LSLALPVFAQYTGPALLSRGEAPAAMAMPNIRFQPFVEVAGTYDTGLANIGVTDQGQLATSAATGVALTWGVSGAHSWRHDKVGVYYRGGLIHYFGYKGYDSVDQSLLFSEDHQFSRHLSATLRTSAGLLKRDFGILSLPQTISFDPASAYIPTTDFFDNRTAYINTQASMAYQRTARLSFYASGTNVLIRRHSKALSGTTGFIANGDMQYRLTRRTTIGATYVFDHFSYTRLFGSSDIHGAAASYSARLTRNLEISGYGGFMRVESLFLQEIPIDPAIAAILGIAGGGSAQIRHTITYIPNVNARLSRTFHNGVVYLSGGRTVTPGNGLFVTSVATAVAGGYQFTGLRFWSASVNADYTASDSVGTIQGNYNGLGVDAALSRQLRRGIHFITGMRARRYSSPDFDKYNRLIYEARVGIGFTPGDVPLRIW
jgi:hypothetical protein